MILPFLQFNCHNVIKIVKIKCEFDEQTGSITLMKNTTNMETLVTRDYKKISVRPELMSKK